MRLAEQPVEGPDVAEPRVDVGVIADVIPEIDHGGWIERRDPDRIDPQVDEMPEAAADALEVADTVAGGVLERARIHLVDNAGLPPAMVVHHAVPPADDVPGPAARSRSAITPDPGAGEASARRTTAMR